ncbi:hypothetical protein [Thalassolituus maritimus]|jgi:hypothetical protein|uniref:Uncharacterized protein n=1 Tax=Thalassolituus maritimus TaxID=484498 RepID=A0ABP9ZXU0_9GAMM|nr:hypothetical protein [Pseudomonadota bacterium]
MYSPAFPHQDIQELFPDVFWVHGSVRVGPGMRLNRNMLILREGRELTLVNPIRLSDAGLVDLDALGDVARVVRLGDFHGADDQFYVDRYQCLFWAQAGQSNYPEPGIDVLVDEASPGPVKHSEFFVFHNARYPESALLLHRSRLLITTDSLQYHKEWTHFSPVSKLAFRFLGFHRGMNIGAPWLKRVTPKGGSMQHDFERLIELDFDALVGAHGQVLRMGAKAAVRTEVRNLFGLEAEI